MNVIQLPMRAYNEILFNCIVNNQLGLLLAHHPVFSSFPSLISASYTWQEIKGWERIYNAEQPIWPLKDGVMTLAVSYELHGMNMYMEQVRQTYDTALQITEEIKALLREGYYIFAPLDRFYFTEGLEYMQQHMIHPSFIYGYDDLQGCFLLMEDCVQHGRFEPYSLAYADFEVSLAKVMQVSAFALEGFRPYPHLPEWSADYFREQVICNIRKLLSAQITEGSRAYIHEGVQGISLFAGHIGKLVPVISNFSALRRNASMPMGLQKRNLAMLDEMYTLGLLDMDAKSSFAQRFEELLALWDRYRKEIFLYSYRNEQDISENPMLFTALQRLLTDIAAKETQAYKNLLQTISG